MAGLASPSLATEVTGAGGIGMRESLLIDDAANSGIRIYWLHN